MLKAFALVKTLKAKGLSLALAESCTGGYASYLITQVPGSSKVFKGGIVVYSLLAKQKLLKIPLAQSKKTQGVSKKIAASLAKNVRRLLKADIGAAVVGFAGPQAPKNVKRGTVYLAVAARADNADKKAVIRGPRDAVRKRSAELLIDLIKAKV